MFKQKLFTMLTYLVFIVLFCSCSVVKQPITIYCESKVVLNNSSIYFCVENLLDKKGLNFFADEKLGDVIKNKEVKQYVLKNPNNLYWVSDEANSSLGKLFIYSVLDKDVKDAIFIGPKKEYGFFYLSEDYYRQIKELPDASEPITY